MTCSNINFFLKYDVNHYDNVSWSSTYNLLGSKLSLAWMSVDFPPSIKSFDFFTTLQIQTIILWKSWYSRPGGNYPRDKEKE